MYPPCLSVNERLIPEMRKRVSKLLRDKGYTQNRIAEILHVTQPMVNKYIRTPINQTFFNDELAKFTVNIVERIESGFSEYENVNYLCDFCMNIRESGKFCSVHYVESCSQCFEFRNVKLLGDRDKLITDLKKAVLMLGSLDVTKIVPEVRMNIAYATKDAKSRIDVIAVPGRLIEVRGKIKTEIIPEFGASKHLAQIILSKMKNSEDRAVINIKFDDALENCLRKLKFKLVYIDRSVVKDIETYPEAVTEYFDVLVDPGTFGIEPATYIFASSPINAVKKVMRICECLW